MEAKINKGKEVIQRRFIELMDLYGSDKVALVTNEEIVGSKPVVGDYVAVINAFNGRCYVPRGSFEAEVDNDFYFVTDDGREAEVNYAAEKSPLIFVTLKREFYDIQASITEASIRLFKSSIERLAVGEEYYLVGESPNIQARGTFLGIHEGYKGNEISACFSNAILCLKRSKQIYATPVDALSKITLGDHSFHHKLIQHGISFDDNSDSYIENGNVVAGVNIEELIGKRVRVVRLGNKSGPKNWIQLNHAILGGIDRKRNELYFDGTPAKTWLKNEGVALILHKKGRFLPDSELKRVKYKEAPNLEIATAQMRGSGIFFNEKHDTYLVNGEVVAGVPISNHTNEWIQIVSFGKDNVFVERNNVHFTCLNINKEIMCENYKPLIPTKGRAVALITNKRL